MTYLTGTVSHQCITIREKYHRKYLDCEHSDTTTLLLSNNPTSVSPSSEDNDCETCTANTHVTVDVYRQSSSHAIMAQLTQYPGNNTTHLIAAMY